MSGFFRILITALNDREKQINRLETQIHMLQHECNQTKSSIQMHRNTIDKLQKNLKEEKKAKEHALNRYKTFFCIKYIFFNFKLIFDFLTPNMNCVIPTMQTKCSRCTQTSGSKSWDYGPKRPKPSLKVSRESL